MSKLQAKADKNPLTSTKIMQGSGNIEILKTSDGSPTLWVKDMDETYHSRHGALTESRYVFIDKGFMELASSNATLNIFELGFGTGLNVLLTMVEAIKIRQHVNFHSVEAFPLGPEIYSQLSYGDHDSELQKIHEVPWNQQVTLDKYFSLHKILGRWEDYKVKGQRFDLIYYDAFAPSRQSEMWSIELLKKMYNLMKPGGKMVTYCAQGAFKRNLKSLEMEIESLPGPPGKAQMIRATK